MRRELLKRTQFLQDYAGIILQIAGVNALAANRFCDSLESALELLTSHPEIGPKAGFANAPDVRYWPIRRYPDYLIFYRVDTASIVLLRLLSGRRELPPLIPNE